MANANWRLLINSSVSQPKIFSLGSQNQRDRNCAFEFEAPLRPIFSGERFGLPPRRSGSQDRHMIVIGGIPFSNRLLKLIYIYEGRVRCVSSRPHTPRAPRRNAAWSGKNGTSWSCSYSGWPSTTPNAQERPHLLDRRSRIWRLGLDYIILYHIILYYIIIYYYIILLSNININISKSILVIAAAQS